METESRIMGLDVGSRTIGVAVSDLLGWTAQGLEVIRRKSLENDLLRIAAIINEYKIVKIVVGLPKNMDNSLGQQAQFSMGFAAILEERFDLPVILRDERLTTMSAKRTLLEADVSRQNRKKVIDKMAAALILQSFLDSQQLKD